MSADPGGPAGRPPAERPPAGLRGWLLVVAGVAGSLDTGQFLATSRGILTGSPGRAAGAALGLLLWLGLTAIALGLALGWGSWRLRRVSVWLAALLTAGSVALVVIHAAAQVGGLRPALGAGLAAAALALAAVRPHRR